MMRSEHVLIRRCCVAVLTLAVILAWPMPMAMAAEDTTGPQKPTGADAKTYHYNKDTGLWENDYYTWDPATQQTTPKEDVDYSYNPDTSRWDTKNFVYDAPSGTYVPNTPKAVVEAPATAKTQASGSENDGSPGGSTSVNGQSNNTGVFDNFYNASISNNLKSMSRSGNVAVLANTAAGGGLSGNADTIATIMNLLQSSTGYSGGDVANFTANVDGDVVGDLLIDPAQIGQMQGLNSFKSEANNNLTVNDRGSGLINNDIQLGAATGDARIADNTLAGDATTGNANAVANVVNVINSIIAFQQSFIGTININGNLDGDILLPQGLLSQLLATGAGSQNNASTTVNNNLTGNFSDNSSVNNNIGLAAASGNASVGNNTKAGSATTGAANTNLTLLNLTGRQVVGQDALLVFVNVLGSWVGLIMNAPSGTNTAALGDSTSAITTNNNIVLNSDTNNAIVNNIDLDARSGDATVENNTEAGNARSGMATASANVSNIINSNLSLANWFGVLFINVFGSWNGSFGVNTAAGNLPVSGPGASTIMSSSSGGNGGGAVFAFAPASGTVGNTSYAIESTAVDSTEAPSEASNSPVLAAVSQNQPSDPGSGFAGQGMGFNRIGLLIAGGAGLLSISMLGAERLISGRQARRA